MFKKLWRLCGSALGFQAAVVHHLAAGLFNILSALLPVLGSPSMVRLCGCLRRFGDLRKNTPLEFCSMYLVCLYMFLCDP